MLVSEQYILNISHLIRVLHNHDYKLFFCGCDTWSVILRVEHCLRVFKSEVLRKLFEPKWEEATGDWRKFHSEELHD